MTEPDFAHEISFGERGAIRFAQRLDDDMLTIQLTTPRGASPTLYLTEDDADRLIAAWEDDGGRFQSECPSDIASDDVKMLTCCRFTDHVAIGIGPNFDEMDAADDAAWQKTGIVAPRWGFAIPLEMADGVMASLHSIVRLGTSSGMPDGQHRRRVDS